MKFTPPQKKLLRRLTIEQKELANRTGYSATQISMVLTGRRFTAHIQHAIAREAGMTVEGLFGRWAYTKRKKRRADSNGETDA